MTEHDCHCKECAPPDYYPDIPVNTPLTQYIGLDSTLRRVPARSKFYFAKVTVNGIETWGDDAPFGVVEAFRGEEDGWVIAVYKHPDRITLCRTCYQSYCYAVIRGKVEIAL